jgi:hypothetical protein
MLGGGAAAALAGTGIYALVDRLTGTPVRRSTRPLIPEQHVLGDLRIVMDEGVEVVVPPLHDEIVTATVKAESRAAALREAQRTLAGALDAVDARYDAAPSGISISVGWGLPYFRRFVSEPARERLPVDLRASEAADEPVLAIVDALRFPSDPEDVILEENDVAFFFRSDRQNLIGEANEAIFGATSDIFELTSIRRGFAGGGFAGGTSLPKRMALAAGVPGAELIPETAELFLGFTSTQKAGLGPPGIANFETLPGYTDQWPDGYFRGGTAMHVSHIFEDVEAWYLNFDFAERVSTTFRPGMEVDEGTQTVPQEASDAVGTRANTTDARRHGAVGHSAVMQPTSRLQADIVGRDGVSYPKGTAVPQRADFNTLDNPFFWSADPARDGQRDEPAAGLHFVVFTPTSDDFHRTRLAMDGVYPDGTSVPLNPRARGQGFNSILHTTHRQNFLVPPRRHRSFPLAELL